MVRGEKREKSNTVGTGSEKVKLHSQNGFPAGQDAHVPIIETETRVSSSANTEEIVAPGVREDSDFEPVIKFTHHQKEEWAKAQRDVDLWETQHEIKLRNKTKEILSLAAFIHNTEKRGLLRADLEKQGYTPSYARRILYLFQEKGLLKPIEGRRRIGRLQEYFLTTKIDKYIESMDDIEKVAKYNDMQRELEEQEAFSFIQNLISYLSSQNPTFHKLLLLTQIPSKYYNTLPQSWIIEHPTNGTKVKHYNLDFRRNAAVNISPNGTTMIHLESTYNPYHLHSPEGLVDFWSACGAVLLQLKADTNDDTGQIPPISKWYLKQHDFDVTVPISVLKEKFPQLKRWWSREGIQLKYLGRVFQIYGKALPLVGKAMRFEGSDSTEENKPLVNGILEAIQPALRYETALELYKQEYRSQIELLQERIKKLEERT